MLSVYFDDSGQDSDAYCCLAGFLAGPSQWKAFSSDWHNKLEKHRIKRVHMKDLWRGNGDFTGWGTEKKQEAIFDFVTSIKKHDLIGFGVAVDAIYWRSLPKAFRKANGEASQFCFERIMRRVEDRHNTPHNKREYISVTFDHARDLARERLKTFQKITEKIPWAKENLASITFSTMTHCVPLQAADMLAWETNRMLHNKRDGRTPGFGKKLLFDGPVGIELAVGEFWGKAEVEKYIDVETGRLKTPAD